MSKPVSRAVLVGAGGHSRVVCDIIQLTQVVTLEGIIDPKFQVNSKVAGIPVLGSDDALPALAKQGIQQVILGMGQVGFSDQRRRMFELCASLGFEYPEIIHPTAIVARCETLLSGFQAMAGVIVNPNVTIGKNVVLNTGCLIEHDCHISDHCFISPGATLCGGVEMGSNSFVGARAVVIQGVKIGRNAVIGAGAVVLTDVPDNGTVVGNPGRLIERKNR